MSGDDNKVTWASLEASADSGTLFLDPAIGKEIPAACDAMIVQLISSQNSIARIGLLTGFGGFTSSKLIEDKINKSVTVGDASVRARLGQQAEQLKQVKRVVEKAIRNYENADYTHGVNLAKFLSQWDGK